jgi:hypothetical protein
MRRRTNPVMVVTASADRYGLVLGQLLKGMAGNI